MKITRMINGQQVEIELMANEMYAAYFEMQDFIDQEDVRSLIDDMSDDELTCEYGVTTEQAYALVPQIAERMRRYMDEGAEMFYAREYAFDEILSDRQEVTTE
jgi:hypothetical protein